MVISDTHSATTPVQLHRFKRSSNWFTWYSLRFGVSFCAILTLLLTSVAGKGMHFVSETPLYHFMNVSNYFSKTKFLITCFFCLLDQMDFGFSIMLHVPCLLILRMVRVLILYPWFLVKTLNLQRNLQDWVLLLCKYAS